MLWGDISYSREKQVRKGFWNGQNSQGSEFNILSSQVSFTWSQVFPFWRNGIGTPKALFCHSDEENHLKEMKSGFHLSSLCFYSYLISNFGENNTFVSLPIIVFNSMYSKFPSTWGNGLLGISCSGVLDIEAGLQGYSVIRMGGSVHQTRACNKAIMGRGVDIKRRK